MNLLFLPKLGHPHSPVLRHSCSWFGDLWTQAGIYTINSPGSQAFRLRQNYTPRFPGSPACRQQTMGLLSLHNSVKRLVLHILYTLYIFNIIYFLFNILHKCIYFITYICLIYPIYFQYIKFVYMCVYTYPIFY